MVQCLYLVISLSSAMLSEGMRIISDENTKKMGNTHTRISIQEIDCR